MRFLGDRLEQLKPHLQRRVEMRVALHKHPGVAGVVEAAAEILKMVTGIELVDLNQPAVGLESVNVGVLPKFKRELQLSELEATRDEEPYRFIQNRPRTFLAASKSHTAARPPKINFRKISGADRFSTIAIVSAQAGYGAVAR
jgi:hypothetical protein